MDPLSELDQMLGNLGATPAPTSAPAVTTPVAAPMAAAAPASTLAAALGPKQSEPGWGNWLASRAGDIFGGTALVGGGLIDLALAGPTFLANRAGANVPYFPTSAYISEGWPQTMEAVGLQPSPTLQEATSWVYPISKVGKGAQMAAGAAGFGASKLAQALAPESTATQIIAPLVAGGAVGAASKAKLLGPLFGSEQAIKETAAAKVLNVLTPEQKTTLAEVLPTEALGAQGTVRTLAELVQEPNVATAQTALGQSVTGQPVLSAARSQREAGLLGALKNLGYDPTDQTVRENATAALSKAVQGKTFQPEEFGVAFQAGELGAGISGKAAAQQNLLQTQIEEAAKAIGVPQEAIDQAATGQGLRGTLLSQREGAKEEYQKAWEKVTSGGYLNRVLPMENIANQMLATFKRFTPEQLATNSPLREIKNRLIAFLPTTDAEGNTVRGQRAYVKDYKDILELAYEASRDASTLQDPKLITKVRALYNDILKIKVEEGVSKAANKALNVVNAARQATKEFHQKWSQGAIGKIVDTRSGEAVLPPEKIANAVVQRADRAQKVVNDFGLEHPATIVARREMLARLSTQTDPTKFLQNNETLFKTLFPDEFSKIETFANSKTQQTGFEAYKNISDSLIPKTIFKDENSVKQFVDSFSHENSVYVEAARFKILDTLMKRAYGRDGKGSLVAQFQQNENKLRILLGDQYEQAVRAAQISDDARNLNLKQVMGSPEAAGKVIADADVKEWLQKLFIGEVIEEGKSKIALGGTGGRLGFKKALEQRMGMAETLLGTQSTKELGTVLDDLQRFENVSALSKQAAVGGSPTNLWTSTLGAIKEPGQFLRMVSQAGNALKSGASAYGVYNLWKGDIKGALQAITTLIGGTALSAVAKKRVEQIAKAEAQIFADPRLLEAALAPPTEQNLKRFIGAMESLGIFTAKRGATLPETGSDEQSSLQQLDATTGSMEQKAASGETTESLMGDIEALLIPPAGAQERTPTVQPTPAPVSVKGASVKLPTGTEYAPHDLVRAVIQAESRGNPSAVSKKGAGGLMQLMPATAKALGIPPAKRFDPQTNVEAGSRYLKQMLDRFGSYELALAAYNFGPTAIAKRLKTIEEGNQEPTWANIKHLVPAETRAYVSKITKQLG
jgi:hypothetical protein